MPLFRIFFNMTSIGLMRPVTSHSAMCRLLRTSSVPLCCPDALVRRVPASCVQKWSPRCCLRRLHGGTVASTAAAKTALVTPTPSSSNSNESTRPGARFDDVHPDFALDSATRQRWLSELRTSLTHPDYFSVTDMFTVEDLFNARLHLGHKEGSLNDYMRPYILGSRLSHIIIDLDKTVPRLHKALNFLAHIAFRNGIILFVARQQQYQFMVEEIAAGCKEYAHTRWWAGGVLTNSTSQFGCMVRLPDAIILLSIHNHILDNNIAYYDAARMRIPTVGVVDTNCDPRLVTYPVPASDDSKHSVEFLAKLFAAAIMRGKEKRKSIRGE